MCPAPGRMDLAGRPAIFTLALALDTSVQALFRAEDDPIELVGRAISPEEYRSILLNRQDTPWTGSRN
jgi:hypothetical protein